MSQLISLTRPISTESATGTLLPWERPYTTEPIATLTHNGANLFHIDMSPSASTRILSQRLVDENATGVFELDPARILNRAAVVARIPAGGDQITASDLTSALAGVQLRSGSALVVLTGFDAADAADASVRRFFTREAASRLAEAVRESGVDLVLTDLPYLTAPGEGRLAEWLDAAPWMRPSWPSPQAATYLAHHYGREHALEDWAPTVELLKSSLLVLGLSYPADLVASELTVTVAPFPVENVGEAPCTVVAARR
jgi:kynurenine formamidase